MAHLSKGVVGTWMDDRLGKLATFSDFHLFSLHDRVSAFQKRPLWKAKDLMRSLIGLRY